MPAFFLKKRCLCQKKKKKRGRGEQSPQNIIAKVKHQWERAKCDKSTAFTAACLLTESSINSEQPFAWSEPLICDKKCHLDKKQSPFNKTLRQTIFDSEGILLLFYKKRILLQ